MGFAITNNNCLKLFIFSLLFFISCHKGGGGSPQENSSLPLIQRYMGTLDTSFGQNGALSFPLLPGGGVASNVATTPPTATISNPYLQQQDIYLVPRTATGNGVVAVYFDIEGGANGFIVKRIDENGNLVSNQKILLTSLISDPTQIQSLPPSYLITTDAQDNIYFTIYYTSTSSSQYSVAVSGIDKTGKNIFTSTYAFTDITSGLNLDPSYMALTEYNENNHASPAMMSLNNGVLWLLFPISIRPSPLLPDRVVIAFLDPQTGQFRADMGSSSGRTLYTLPYSIELDTAGYFLNSENPDNSISYIMQANDMSTGILSYSLSFLLSNSGVLKNSTLIESTSTASSMPFFISNTASPTGQILFDTLMQQTTSSADPTIIVNMEDLNTDLTLNTSFATNGKAQLFNSNQYTNIPFAIAQQWFPDSSFLRVDSLLKILFSTNPTSYPISSIMLSRFNHTGNAVSDISPKKLPSLTTNLPKNCTLQNPPVLSTKVQFFENSAQTRYVFACLDAVPVPNNSSYTQYSNTVYMYGFK
jgi:hypothetical protein